MSSKLLYIFFAAMIVNIVLLLLLVTKTSIKNSVSPCQSFLKYKSTSQSIIYNCGEISKNDTSVLYLAQLVDVKRQNVRVFLKMNFGTVEEWVNIGDYQKGKIEIKKRTRSVIFPEEKKSSADLHVLDDKAIVSLKDAVGKYVLISIVNNVNGDYRSRLEEFSRKTINMEMKNNIKDMTNYLNTCSQNIKYFIANKYSEYEKEVRKKSGEIDCTIRSYQSLVVFE